MTDPKIQNNSMETLRNILHNLPPAGEAGFEGLVATMIASITGLQVRLAKSGSQFGRDASSPTGPFAIAMEAKRYDSSLRLEDLIGKASLATSALGSDTDLWVLGATTEVGDDTVRKLSKFFEEHGMSLLMLDWSTRPIPPLAILLALRSQTTKSWFARFHPTLEQTDIQDSLGEILQHESFPVAQTSLMASLSSAEVGLGALRERNKTWLRERWSDSALSRQEFGQIITPLMPTKQVLAGRAAGFNLNSLVISESRRAVIAVLGDEGVGKTWIIADWWLGSVEPPLFLPVIGKAIELLDSGDPVGSIAKLLERSYKSARVDAAGWERRVRRWSQRAKSNKPWLVVCFDGLNERTDRPWGNLVSTFGEELAKMGGALLVTCRPGFWGREVVSRLERSLARTEILIGEYTPSEVDELLNLNGIAPNTLSERVRKFIQNPRIGNVALTLLGELAATPGELTTERLQSEYWKQRLKERGNLVQHDLTAFFEILKEHAKKLGSDPNRRFPLYDWFEKSPLGKRGLSAVERDTSDVVEGLFMRATESDPSSYQFRPEALPFALGLCVAHGLRDLQPGDSASFDEALDGLIQPVRGFDLTAEIIGAAFGLSCLDKTYSGTGQRALLRAWATLQNLDEEALEAMAPNAQIRADIFCDIIEELQRSGEYHPHAHQLERFLFARSAEPHVRDVMAERMPGWLNRWSKIRTQFPGVKRKNKEQDFVAETLALLTPSERQEVEAICAEVTDPNSVRTDELAAFQLLSGPQAVYAKSIWAWCLAQTIAPDYRSPQEDLQWAIRLNIEDWKETSLALRATLQAVTGQSSEPYRRAASRALRLLGDLESEAIAESLTGPLGEGSAWRRVESFCDTNPHDPNAPVCDNLSNAITTLADIDLNELHTGRFSNTADHNFATVTPALARFAPEPLVEMVRKFVSSMERREGMALLALTWELDDVSPALDATTVAVVERSLKRFATDEVDWSIGDNQLVVNRALGTIFPHISVDEQLELLLGLPTRVRMFVNLIHTVKQASTEQLEAAFNSAANSSNPSANERVLFVASAFPVELNASLRTAIRRQISGGSQTARNVALDVIRQSSDQELDDDLLQQARQSPIEASDSDEFYRTEAVIQAVIRSGQAADLELVPANLKQAAAAWMGDDAIVLVTDHIDTAVRRLLGDVQGATDFESPVVVETTPDGLMQRIDLRTSQQVDFKDVLTGDPEAAAREFNESQERRRNEHQEITKRLVEHGAEMLLAVPSQRCLARVTASTPSRVDEWLSSILAEQDRGRLLQIFNLGTALAAGFARVDGALSAKVLRHLAGLQPFTRIRSGDMQIPIYAQAVFAESESLELAQLRQETVERATNDADLELYARAASTCGSHIWLSRYIQSNLSTEHPALQARAMTLAGFCFPEDDLAGVFAGNLRTGFLGQVSKFALKQRQRAEWAEHWCKASLSAENGVDFWRFGKLAEAVVDGRFVRSFVSGGGGSMHAPYEDELYVRLKKSAESRNKERQKTLFGLKVPSDRMLWTIANSRIS